jgi:hypothetical protein
MAVLDIFDILREWKWVGGGFFGFDCRGDGGGKVGKVELGKCGPRHALYYLSSRLFTSAPCWNQKSSHGEDDQ